MRKTNDEIRTTRKELGRNSREEGRNSRETGRVARSVSCARATRGRGLPSLDARSGRPIQATLLENIRASVDGQLEWSFDARTLGLIQATVMIQGTIETLGLAHS